MKLIKIETHRRGRAFAEFVPRRTRIFAYRPLRGVAGQEPTFEVFF